MQKLSNVPFQSLRIGDRVKSSYTGNEGMIYKLIPIEHARRRDDNEIMVKWDTGSVSYQWQYCYDGIWLM